MSNLPAIYGHAMVYIFIAVLKNTLLQALWLFGGLIVPGIILHFLSRGTRTLFAKSFGTRFFQYTTGWLGTPIHEIGHVIGCILFGHSIQSVRLFSFNGHSAAARVVHSYNRKNLYHQAGNFFIAIGPLIVGSLVLFFLLFQLVPLSESRKILIGPAWPPSGTLEMLQSLFARLTMVNGTAPITWLVLYFALCVAAHMELSPADLRGILPGLMFSIFLLAAVNGISRIYLPLQQTVHDAIFVAGNMLNILLQIAVVISTILFLMTWILFFPIYLVRTGHILHPFR